MAGSGLAPKLHPLYVLRNRRQRTDMGWDIVPWGFEKLLSWIQTLGLQFLCGMGPYSIFCRSGLWVRAMLTLSSPQIPIHCLCQYDSACGGSSDVLHSLV